MNHTRLVIGVLTMGLLSFLFGCGNQDANETETLTSQYDQVDIYRDLRLKALSYTADDLQLGKDSDQPIVVLMETGYPEAAATLLASADGSASLYFSSGGGVIGAGEHEPVREVALSFLQSAYEARAAMQKTESFPLPGKDRVRFYLVTSDGIYTAEALTDDLGNMREELSSLFHKGHEVITALRLISESQ